MIIRVFAWNFSGICVSLAPVVVVKDIGKMLCNWGCHDKIVCSQNKVLLLKNPAAIQNITIHKKYTNIKCNIYKNH